MKKNHLQPLTPAALYASWQAGTSASYISWVPSYG